MQVLAREMMLEETDMVIEYFHSASPEHLEMLGVDPGRLPEREIWAERFRRQLQLDVCNRSNFFVTWLKDGKPVGFSSCDRIVFGEQAYMHLHVARPDQRQRGIGAEGVRQSVEIYFKALELKRLYCEPNAFNVGPNRTLQKAGFRYVKTHMTVPGPLNFHQAVTRWVIER